MARFDTLRFNWVIMEARMPGRGGFFASRQITARGPGAHSVLISQCGDEPMANEAGAMDFISKDRIAELPESLLGFDGNPASLTENI